MKLGEEFFRQRSRRNLCQSQAPSNSLLGQSQLSVRGLGVRTPSKRNGLGKSSYTDPSALLRKPFLSLAKHGKFEEIEEILKALKASDLATWLEDFSPAQNDAGLEAFRGATMLHLIMEYKPPATLVDVLILRLSELKDGIVPEDATDLRGRTPLHLAVHYCCEPSVIKRLVYGVVSVLPAVTKDSTGRLPLHWACENPQGFTIKSACMLCCGNRPKNCDKMVEIIEMLMKVYPHAVTVKDMAGNTPLTLAIANGADHNTILLLDRAYQKLRGENASTSSGTNETEIEVDFPVDYAGATYFDPHDPGDDVSSIGTGGISRYNRVNRTVMQRRTYRPLPYIHEQIQI